MVAHGLALAALSVAALVASAPSSHAMMPRFSWDTVPVFYHSCNFSGAYSQEALGIVTKFPLVTIEKGQGLTDGSGRTAEAKILDQLAAVKAADPSIATVAYFNSVLDWTMYGLHQEMLKNPHWWLHNSSGDVVRIRGDRSFPQPPEGMLVFDFAQAVVRQTWSGACMALVKTGHVDGCFSDRAGEDDPSWGSAYAAGHVKVQQDLQAAIGDGPVVANGLIIDGVSSTMIEPFAATGAMIAQLNESALAGKLVEAHAGYKVDGSDNHCEDVTDALAAFLIAARENSFFGCSQGWDTTTDPVSKVWHEEYDKPLGAPTGDATLAGDVWTRSFASGTVVEFNIKTNTGTITWAKSHHGDDAASGDSEVHHLHDQHRQVDAAWVQDSGLDALQPMVPRTVPASIADPLGAKCLDGSAPSYAIRRNPASTKFVLFLEGGGWCFGPDEASTIKSCAGRAAQYLGTGRLAGHGGRPRSDRSGGDGEGSVQFAQDYGGLLSANATINPDFHTWNAVFIHYCDGASFGGGHDGPVVVDPPVRGISQIWLRGRANLDAVLQDLKTNFGIAEATETILSGGSAGGLAAIWHADHVAASLGSHTRTVAAPDAGFFLDAKDITGAYTYRAMFIGADPVWNVTGSGGTNSDCLAAHASTQDTWKCLMAQYVVPHVHVPVHVMNSAADLYQAANILRLPCAAHDVTTCNATEVAVLDAYSRLVNATLVATVVDGVAAAVNGAFLDACWVHEQNVDYCSTQPVPNCVGWTPSSPGSLKWGYKTAVQGLTPQQAFSEWYLGSGAARKVVLDAATWPGNPSCVYSRGEY